MVVAAAPGKGIGSSTAGRLLHSGQLRYDLGRLVGSLLGRRAMSPLVARTLVWVPALLPALAGMAMTKDADFASPGSTVNFLGRLAGIAGLTLMLVAAILSCRVPGFDRPFGGLTKLWKTHHQLATAAFLLLLAHPVLLAFGAAPAGLDTMVDTLVPSDIDEDLWTGWGALLLLMIFLAPGYRFFGKLRYQRWKSLHGLAAPTVVLAVVHTYGLARTLPWAWEMLLFFVLSTLALVSIGYRFFWSRLFGRRPYRIVRVERPANNVVELELASETSPLRYEAGQFVYLTPKDPALAAGRGEEHPYTLCSAPGDPHLRIAIKARGDASRALQDVTVGSHALVEGPYGGLFPATTSPAVPELWIAGGIGVTPFLGRARHLASIGEAVDIVMIFCVQDEPRALWLDQLLELTSELPGFVLHMHYFYRHGPLAERFVTRVCPTPELRTLYICGPEPLLDLAQKVAHHVGIPRSRIVTEEIDLL